MPHKDVFFYSIILLSIAGCSFLSETKPQWINQLPRDNHSFYAIGQGVDIFNAEENARVSLASQFGATVNDQTSIYTLSDHQFSQTLVEIITSVDIVDIKLTQAKTIRQAQYNNSHYVLMALEKSSFKTQLEQDIKQQVSTLQSTVNQQNEEGFGRWWTLRQILPTAKSLEHNALLLNSIYPQKSKNVEDTLNAFYLLFNQKTLARKLIINNKTDINALTDEAEKQLHREKIAIDQHHFHRLPFFKSDQITINDHYTKEKIGQDFFVTGVLDIKLTLTSGQTLSHFQITDQSVSLSGFSDSTGLVKKRLIERFSKTNIISCFIEKNPSCSKGI